MLALLIVKAWLLTQLTTSVAAQKELIQKHIFELSITQ